MTNGGKVIPVKVALRTRPLVSKEIAEGAKECLQFIKEANQVIVNGSKGFTYDYIFDPKTSQEIVYKSAVYPLIGGIFKGYNGTVLAYGQTGSGKTFTMGSAHSVSKAGIIDTTTGVIPRVIKDLFDGINERSEEYEFVVKVWYAEIYKEDVKDLLAHDPSSARSLNIREFIDGSIKIAGITEVVVDSPASTLELMETGNAARATGCTAMNKTSSRSHAIFTVIMESRSIKDPDDYTHSRFHLVDLAGSERIKRTKAEGERLQEGIKINSGLLALGNVISALGENKPGHHIPYRDSKLTRLLQNSLGGNSMTVMIACASPANTNHEETFNTLRYADRARKIKNKAIVNRDPQTAELARLRQEVQSLRSQLKGGVVTEKITPSLPAECNDREQLLQEVEMHKQNTLNLSEELDRVVRNYYEMCQKIVGLESTRDNIRTQIYDLQDSARNVCDDTHDLSIIEEVTTEESQRECVKKLRHLQQHVLKIKIDENDITQEAHTMDVDRTSLDSCTSSGGLNLSHEAERDLNVTAAEKQKHILNSANLASQLQELTKAINMKEDMVNKMNNNDEIKEIKDKYEKHVKVLDEQIEKLERERKQLMAHVEGAKKNESKKLSDQRRQQIVVLEGKIKQLQVEKKEKEKLVKLKAQSDTKIVKLTSDITGLKQARTKLMRQMKEETSKHLQWKKQKENEVKQLQKKDRKRQVELSKMEINMKKQKNVLQRKNEEVASTLRRLNAALMRNKQTNQKRNLMQQKKYETDVQKWKGSIDNELEVRVQVQVAKKCQKSIEEDIVRLQNELKSLDDADKKPKQKKRRRTLLESEVHADVAKRKELEGELRLANEQIKSIQEKVEEGKESIARYEARWASLSSLSDLRSLIKYLMNMQFDKKVAEQRESSKNKLDNEQIEVLKKEIYNLRRSYHQLDYESNEKILTLTKELNQGKTLTKENQSWREQIQMQATAMENQELRIAELTEERDALIAERDAKNAKKKKKAAPVPEMLSDLEEEEDMQSEEDDEDLGDEYIPTPILKRMKRRTQQVVQAPKPTVPKLHCTCKAESCANKKCSCRKAGRTCGDDCGCGEGCKNTSSNDISESSLKEESIDNATVDSQNSSGGGLNTTFVATAENPVLSSWDTPKLIKGSLLGDLEDDSANGENFKKPSQVTSKLQGDGYSPVYFDSPLKESNNKNSNKKKK